jgi:hypothetical protein
MEDDSASSSEEDTEMKQARMNQQALHFLLQHRRVFCLREAIFSQCMVPLWQSVKHPLPQELLHISLCALPLAISAQCSVCRNFSLPSLVLISISLCSSRKVMVFMQGLGSVHPLQVLMRWDSLAILLFALC